MTHEIKSKAMDTSVRQKKAETLLSPKTARPFDFKQRESVFTAPTNMDVVSEFSKGGESNNQLKTSHLS